MEFVTIQARQTDSNSYDRVRDGYLWLFTEIQGSFVEI